MRNDNAASQPTGDSGTTVSLAQLNEAGQCVDVDVVQRHDNYADASRVRVLAEAFVRAAAARGALAPGALLTEEGLRNAGADTTLLEHIRALAICDACADLHADTPLSFHVHKLDTASAERDTNPESGDEPAAFESWALPHEQFHGLWESLEFETPLKADALRFARTTLELAARGADSHLLAVGRVVLLHGPPGAGKTSLCRALAHKLAVHETSRFARARLLEVNAHGIFSKWFSESGKLVARLFDRIDEIVEDPHMLAVVLVDEVESLTHARSAALSGAEPSDAVRAVNAVLAALDRLRRRPNAFVLATSNLTDAIDPAFVDRADLKRLVPAPGARASYAMLRASCGELTRCGMLARDALFSWRVLHDSRFAESAGSRASLQLARIAQHAAAKGVSGRALRRLPVIALALHAPSLAGGALSLPGFLTAMDDALEQYLRDELDLDRSYSKHHAPLTNGIN